MLHHPRAGQPAQPNDCIDIQQLIADYYTVKPQVDDPTQAVHFGTSGHRGSAFTGSFNQHHILAIAQAIVEIRRTHQITGCLFLGRDTHALSEPAFMTVLEVLTAQQVPVVIQAGNGFTPTPVISHAILCHNRHNAQLADGIIITPSHNPPHEGGIKYNPPHGGPAELPFTTAIEQRANALLANGLQGIKRASIAQARQQGWIIERDWIHPYVVDLVNVVDMPAIQQAQLKLAVDPLGGAGIAYWQHIADYYQLDLTIVNDTVDATFGFMPLDQDGVIRMDCSSPYAMANVLKLCPPFDLAFGSDPDHDRHGIVTPKGLMEPNHYLAVAIDYLLQHRPQWGQQVAVGKTVVSSALIDRVVMARQRRLVAMPVGFKWFVQGLYQGSLGFAGEESAGASFLRFDGTPWSTDKDGIILCLLAAEINAVTGQDPAHYYQRLTTQLGAAHYRRSQRTISDVHRELLAQRLGHTRLPEQLAGDPVTACVTTAPGNGTSFGGLKVSSDTGWFAIRPSGTEALCKIYCESLIDSQHCLRIERAAHSLVDHLLEQTELLIKNNS